MCNVRHDVKDTLLNVPLLTKGKKNLKHIATNRNYVHAGIYSMKRPKINSHSQVSLSSGKPIKCRISLFSGVEITMRPIRDRVSCFFTCQPYLSDCHSCPTGVGSISLFKPFAKFYKVGLFLKTNSVL